MHWRPFIFLLSGFIIFSGCSRNKIFDKISDLDGRAWPKSRPVIFQFNIRDTHPEYSLEYNIRNSVLYKYYNLYLSYTLEDTLGNVLDSALTSYDLFDAKTGKPLGDGLGDIFDHEFPVRDHYRFNNPGVYRFIIKQYMREDTLMEIMSVGLIVRKSNNGQTQNN